LVRSIENSGIPETGIDGSLVAPTYARDPADFAGFMVNGALNQWVGWPCLETAVNHEKCDGSPVGVRTDGAGVNLILAIRAAILAARC
jgi:hypothetical protein